MGTGERGAAVLSDDSGAFSDGLLNAVQDVFYVCDPDGTVVRYNDRVPEVTGYSEADIESMRAWEFFPERERDWITEAVTRIVEKGATIRTDVPYLTADGEEIPYEFSGSPVRDEEGEIIGFAGIGRDISERRAHEADLERQNDLFEKAQDIADVGAWEYNPQDGEAYFTDQVYEIYGVDRDHEPEPESDIQRFYHPGDRDTVREAVAGALEDGEPYDIEVRITAADGTEKWVRTRADPFFEDGTCQRVRGTIQDITDRKERERELTRQRDNLEVLDQMVRHDLRNNLQVVSGHAEALEQHVGEDGATSIEKILRNIDAAVELTKSARDLSEVMLQNSKDRATISLRDALGAQLDEARAAEKAPSITVDGTIPDVAVVGDEMVSSIFRNLLQNAVRHNDKDEIEITVSATELDEAVAVRIADNGPGIPDERKATVFEKGERGANSEGTGIGLYLVKSLVESYGGSIRIEDNDPEGAVFVVECPLAA